MPSNRLHTTAIVIAILLAALIVWVLIRPEPVAVSEPLPETTLPGQATSSKTVIGTSVEGRDIEVYSFGTGETKLLFVGGMHGGYEWNSVVIAEYLIEDFADGSITVPEDLTVNIIPNLNPDGVYKVLGMTGGFTEAEALAVAPTVVPEGRFNANGIDLNRNFDCKWQPTSTWRGNVVSAGAKPFSEPEAAALRDYVLETNPAAVIFWHSQANNVYASECEDGVLPATKLLMQTYARAGSYGEVLSFDAYPVTGDAEGWLASIGIPAITVELETRTGSEWTRNLAGTESVLRLYGETLAR